MGGLDCWSTWSDSVRACRRHGGRTAPHTQGKATRAHQPEAASSAVAHAQLVANSAPSDVPAPSGTRGSTSVHSGAQRRSCSSPTAHALALGRFYVSAAFRALAASSSDCASGVKVTDKMVPPVQVSPLIKLGRYSALFLGVAYGAKRYSYLKPRAEEERRLAAEEKQRQEERKRIERELAEGSHRLALPDLTDLSVLLQPKMTAYSSEPASLEHVDE
uniref:ATP synthase F(0) complex subunit e, mitochondrial n=1 Tax=Suricata suricatta TaxID=37032 RepID=A0A673UXU9_SURSU